MANYINGVKYEGNSISINNGVVKVGGKVVDTGKKFSSLEIKGDALLIECDVAVTVHGDVAGNVIAGGSVSCDDVGGDVQAGGSVSCDDVGGKVFAGGSVVCDSMGR